MSPAKPKKSEEELIKSLLSHLGERSLDDLCREFYSAACTALKEERGATPAVNRLIRKGYLCDESDIDSKFGKLFSLTHKYFFGVKITSSEYLKQQGITRAKRSINSQPPLRVSPRTAERERGAKRAVRTKNGDYHYP